MISMIRLRLFTESPIMKNKKVISCVFTFEMAKQGINVMNLKGKFWFGSWKVVESSTKTVKNSNGGFAHD